MTLLSLAVEEKLQAAGLPAVVISPFSFALMNDGDLQEFPTKIIENCLHAGCVVVTHGDVCFDKTRYASILSGDTIAAYLAKNLAVKSIYIGTNVDGVFNDDPQTNPQANHISIIDSSNIHNVLAVAGPSDTVDVTGGMLGKVKELIELAKENIEIVIFNLTVPGRLFHLLTGEPVVCTRIQL
jgi:isopentenyl phosphate kinase